MKISYNWLKDYVKTDLSAEKVAELLTFGGLEVESIEVEETVKGGLNKYVVGEVLTCVDHPDSDHLHLTTVNVGTDTPLNIVCGAPNVAAGQKVIVATVGAKVYTSDTEYFEIKKSKLRGAPSEGMICSEAELQISSSHDGIMVLDANAVVGTPAKEYLKIEEDYVLEIGLTPNRGDAASHIGVGRDLAALLQTQLKQNISLTLPSVDAFKVDNNSKPVEIKTDIEICPRYSGLTISGVEIKDSPEWLANRLKLIGLRPINNIIDVTNYVLMELGHPLHAFDLAKVKGNKIEVKTLPKGTKFVTLDGVERELNGKEAMVCNAEEGMCMGGVYGGLESGVSNTTKDIFLESAYFNPVTIRKGSKYHGLKTDASFRFERGADPNMAIYALKRAALLIKEIAGGEITSDIVDVYPQEIKQTEVELNFGRINSLVGKAIEPSTIKTILTSLEIGIVKEDNDGMIVSVPTNKVDVTRECDVIEEILRIYGYNNIEISDNVRSSLSYQSKPNTEKIQNTISDILAANGFNEIMNNSLTKTAYYEDNTDYPIESCASILNALSKDLGVMRQTLLYGALEVLSYNINRKVSNIKTFEFGNCYSKNLDQIENDNVRKRYNEEKHLFILTSGNTTPESWQAKEQKTDFFYLKNIVENIFERLRIDISRFVLEPSTMEFLSEGLQFVNRDNKKVVAYFGKLNVKVRKQFNVKQDAFVADFTWDLIIKAIPSKDIKYQEVSKFPEVRRDLALVIDKNVTFAQMRTLALQTEKKLLKNVTLFDVYEGDKLPEGKKQYALSFTLQDTEKTLTDSQIDGIMSKFLKNFEEKLGAKLR